MGRHTTKLGKRSRAQSRPPLPYPVHDGRVPPALQAAMDRRAHRRKSQLAAFSAASMLAIGGAAGVSIATADEPEAGSGSEVVFSGDCGTLGLVSAASTPNASEITVEQGSQVRYSNELGTDAKLHVGDEVHDIEAGGTQVFVMNRSAEVAMVPECHGLFAEYASAQVRVVAAQSGEDESGDGTEVLPDTGSGDSGSDGDEDAGAEAPQGDPEDSNSGSGTSSATESEARQGPDDESPVPAETPTPDEDVNAFGPPPSTEDAGAVGDAPVAAEHEVVAVDPKAVADGANGLLALVAIICLVGVAAAVARTLLKQRATA